MKILVLEDDPTVRRLVVRVVRPLGTEVVEACFCAEARAVKDCGLGVFDVDLPDGDGVELAQELLKTGQVGAVVFYTGRPMNRAADVGAIVTKGSDAAELRAAVDAARLRLVLGSRAS